MPVEVPTAGARARPLRPSTPGLLSRLAWLGSLTVERPVRLPKAPLASWGGGGGQPPPTQMVPECLATKEPSQVCVLCAVSMSSLDWDTSGDGWHILWWKPSMPRVLEGLPKLWVAEPTTAGQVWGLPGEDYSCPPLSATPFSIVLLFHHSQNIPRNLFFFIRKAH